ncbi:Apolipoprotein L domain-containing protein 1 [Oryzias melastigma]|uniref:Apolipoprotein L domain-containing protein 1 n=1 Tax=Oryzias melastigma TaxID=30732 RepID=A0A834CPI4_ORYME|nr:Apolipoprotein L domain-containing protein 1 [Oryzias melastigma]
MKGEAAEGDVDGSADVESTERRPSAVKLQNMLLKASYNPFQSNSFLDSESSDIGGPFANQNEEQENLWPQNRVSARSNPFYAYYLESRSQNPLEENKRIMSDGKNPDKNLFLRSPLDLPSELKTPNGVLLPEPFSSSQAFNQEDHTSPSSSLGNGTSATDGFVDGLLKSSDHSSSNTAQAQNLSNSWDAESSDVVRNTHYGDFKENDFIQTEQHYQDSLFEPPKAFEDPFESPSNTGYDLFQSPQAAPVNPFYTSDAQKDNEFEADPNEDFFKTKEVQSKEKQLLRSTLKENVDIFPSTSTNPDDMFPSPLSRNLFQDFSSDEPLNHTPSKPQSLQRDALDDIFLPYPSEDKENRNTFATASSEGPSPLTHSITRVPPPLPKKVPPPLLPKPLQRPNKLVLTTPQGTKLDVLKSTPLLQPRSLSPSPSSAEMTHVSTVKRPPKPLPRSKPPMPEKPPRPDKPPSPVTSVNSEPEPPTQLLRRAFKSVRKPSFSRRAQNPETKPVDPKDYVVFDDILLIGEEKCVEDWPEDSPELDPDWKPTGKLKLRRDTLKMERDLNGEENQDQAEGHIKKKDKGRMSMLSKRGSKEKINNLTEEKKSSTLPRKSSKEYSTDQQTSAEQNQEEYSTVNYRKKSHKNKVGPLFRRASSASVMSEGQQWDGQDFKDRKQRDTMTRRWSEGKMLDASSGEDEEGSVQHGEKRKKLKIKFIPQRGFAISLEKLSNEPKGAAGSTPRKDSKIEDLRHSNNNTPDGMGQAAAMDHDDPERPGRDSPGPDASHKPKKAAVLKHSLKSRRSSKVNAEDSAEDLEDGVVDRPEGSKTKHFKGKRKSKTTNTPSESSECSSQRSETASAEGFAEEDQHDEEDDGDDDLYKPKKLSKMKGFKKGKRKSKSKHQEGKDPAGAAGNEHLSEAAKAEWLAAQKDERTVAGEDEDEDEDGDTDSLMEWWYTVEKWDEVLSDEEDAAVMKDESKSFTILADKVDRGLRVFNKMFTERAEVLWQSVIMLHTLADDISEFHHKAKIAGITGGTTTAVGGIAAITGLVLVPFTLGASLVITAVGAGVAAAGGITSASAAISDNVNNNNERKKMEVLLKEYEDQLEDIANILHFVNQGLYRLRGHPFLRSGTQHYSQDWEIRRAVQMISMVDSPVMKATEVADKAVSSLQGLFKGMDEYFVKESRELKKGCRKEVVGRIREVAGVLNDSLVDLNAIREELQEATGFI